MSHLPRSRTMKRICLLVCLGLLAGCAQLLANRDEPDPMRQLWDEAQQALTAMDYPRAAESFNRIAERFPDSSEARESLFFLGMMRLDPRNPEWDPKPAEELLLRYMTPDSASPVAIQRRTEAETLYQLANQLNLPPEDRIPELQPETKVVEKVVPRRVAPVTNTRAAMAEAARLRREVSERDARIREQQETIRNQQEELERIRKTLTGRGGRGGR